VNASLIVQAKSFI